MRSHSFDTRSGSSNLVLRSLPSHGYTHLEVAFHDLPRRTPVTARDRPSGPCPFRKPVPRLSLPLRDNASEHSGAIASQPIPTPQLESQAEVPATTASPRSAQENAVEAAGPATEAVSQATNGRRSVLGQVFVEDCVGMRCSLHAARSHLSLETVAGFLGTATDWPASHCPFVPASGKVPPYLAGRESELRLIRDQLAWLQQAASGSDVIIYGPRGNGKTALMESVLREARATGIATLKFTSADIESKEWLARHISVVPS